MRLKFIVSHDHLKNRLNELKKFSSKQEIAGLLVEDDESILEIVKELTNISPVNEEEAVMFLLKLREISVDDTMESIISCTHCNTMNQLQLEMSEFINYDTKFTFNDNVLPKGIFKTASDIINNRDLDKLSFKEYGELDEIIKKQNASFFVDTNRVCRKCKKNIPISIDPRKSFSKSNLTNVYKEYTTLMMMTNNGKLDIDSMYPFERALFLSIITAESEDKGK